jgi:hypothetical protein
MKRYWSYLKYLCRHRWFVFVSCLKCGIIWRGLVHDLSKFLPDEFIPYARYFYNPDGTLKSHKRDKTGYYKPPLTGDFRFDFAWLLHQKRNKHHWQWWLLPEDGGEMKVLEMEFPYWLEMVCDWSGAGKAQGHGNDLKAWYKKNKDKMRLAPETKEEVEYTLEVHT